MENVYLLLWKNIEIANFKFVIKNYNNSVTITKKWKTNRFQPNEENKSKSKKKICPEIKINFWIMIQNEYNLIQRILQT